jgi:hypothetical protein
MPTIIPHSEQYEDPTLVEQKPALAQLVDAQYQAFMPLPPSHNSKRTTTAVVNEQMLGKRLSLNLQPNLQIEQRYKKHRQMAKAD